MQIPVNEPVCEIEIKRSRFISTLTPIKDQDELKAVILAQRTNHPQASHVVSAFVLGDQGDFFGYSDDHEPKNTAGRPVYEVLKGSGLTRCAITVVRYFGGTKLGTGGLVKAYTEAAKLVVELAEREELISRKRFSLVIPYHLFDRTKKALLEAGVSIEEETFLSDIHLSGFIPEDAVSHLRSILQDISSGTLDLLTDY